jgi:hypothetical protein
LHDKAAQIWAKEGLAVFEIVWENPRKIRVEFWTGYSAWLKPGDMIQGYTTSTGLVFTSILRRRYRN